VHKLNVICHFYCHSKYVYRISVHLVQWNSFWSKILLFVAHPALSVGWSISIMSNVIFITVTSMSTKFQLIWSNRTHSDPSCYFCGTSSTSSNLVHKLNILCHFYCLSKYVYQISVHLVQWNSFWPNILLFVAHPILPETWSVNSMSCVISIALASMCIKFQFIWSNGTHSDPIFYFLWNIQHFQKLGP
jgi:hypothetical protein